MTVQISERIIYKNEESWTDSQPLDQYLSKRNEIQFVAQTSACWRGYKGKWQVVENKLFLIELEANIRGLDRVDINYLFPNQNKVFADWFNGEIIIPRGNCLNEDDDTYLPIFEEEIILRFKNGLLEEENVKNNRTQKKNNDDSEIYDLINGHKINSKIKFGKHRGKTILEIYSGTKIISQHELEIIYSLFGESEITSSKSLHIVHGLLKGSGGEDLIRERQKILLKYLPDPDYINWCISNVEGFDIAANELEKLEKIPIVTLIRIVKKDGTYEAIYNESFQKFSSEIKNKSNTKENPFRNMGIIDPHFKDDYSSDYSINSSYCSACQEPIPCGCNYSIENNY